MEWSGSTARSARGRMWSGLPFAGAVEG